jgi:hypothetical protein
VLPVTGIDNIDPLLPGLDRDEARVLEVHPGLVGDIQPHGAIAAACFAPFRWTVWGCGRVGWFDAGSSGVVAFCWSCRLVLVGAFVL